MADEQHPVSPVAAVLQVLGGFWTARAVYVAAKLGLADLRPAAARCRRTAGSS